MSASSRPLDRGSRGLTVGVIGAGRVGGVLGSALVRAGHQVVAASGISAAARTRIAELLPDAANRPADEVARAATDLLLVAVPDDALGAVVENALRLGDDALTGPVSRADAGTVARHLDQLARVAPESVPGYLAMARRTADRAIAAGRIRPADAGPLLDVLGTGERERVA